MNVQEACKAVFAPRAHDCSGFARAVGEAVNVALSGDANEIADLLAATPGGWVALKDGPDAAAASRTQFVLAALRGDQHARPNAHGHVVVIVPGPLAHDKYPSAWWGSLGGTPGQNQTINWAWTDQDRDKVVYAAHGIPA